MTSPKPQPETAQTEAAESSQAGAKPTTLPRLPDAIEDLQALVAWIEDERRNREITDQELKALDAALLGARKFGRRRWHCHDQKEFLELAGLSQSNGSVVLKHLRDDLVLNSGTDPEARTFAVELIEPTVWQRPSNGFLDRWRQFLRRSANLNLGKQLSLVLLTVQTDAPSSATQNSTSATQKSGQSDAEATSATQNSAAQLPTVSSSERQTDFCQKEVPPPVKRYNGTTPERSNVPTGFERKANRSEVDRLLSVVWELIPDDQHSEGFWRQCAAYWPMKFETALGELRYRLTTGQEITSTRAKCLTYLFKEELGHQKWFEWRSWLKHQADLREDRRNQERKAV